MTAIPKILEPGSDPDSPPARKAPGLDAEAIKELKGRDNRTNWYHLAHIYVVIAATIGAAIYATHTIDAMGLPAAWRYLVNAVAVIIIGAAQHQFGGAIHEGTHFLLFKDRRLNEIASDWLAAFPIYTSTHQFRIHHLAHHQFVNDPERDPDIAQLKESGHWLDFPVPSIELLWSFVKQLSPLQLMRFTLTRAKYSAVGFDHHAYIDPESKSSKWPLRVGIIFAIPVSVLASALSQTGHDGAAALTLGGAFVVVVAYLLWTDEQAFQATRVAPVISHRATMLSRVAYFGLLYGAILAIQTSGLAPAWHYFGLYWVLPLFTTFPLFMMLRQWLQHGNADRGRYTNTRTFLVGPLIRYAVFPWGMDYHLPHHMMASVPHYRLKRLHALLQSDPEYRTKGVIIDGLFVGREGPSIVASLGPAHAPVAREQAFVDNDTLEYAEVTDKVAIAREAELSAQGR